MQIIVDKEKKQSRLQQLKEDPRTAPTVRLVFAIIEQALLDLLEADLKEQQSAYHWIKTNYWAFELFGIDREVVRAWVKRALTDSVFRAKELKIFKEAVNKAETPSEKQNRWEGNVYKGNFKDVK